MMKQGKTTQNSVRDNAGEKKSSNERSAHSTKPLLVFAHRGEAQVFLEQLSFQPVPFYFDGFYQSTQSFLLISGEGLQSVTEKVSAILSQEQFNISEVINLGVAGGLSKKLAKFDILSVRTAYAASPKDIQFKSFTSADEDAQVDCVTSTERVFEQQSAKHFACIADLVDREIWALASVCALFKKSWTAFKIISDLPTSEEVRCDFIRDQAFEFSQRLYQFFQNRTIKGKADVSRHGLAQSYFEDSKYYWTHSQRQLAQSLFQKFNSMKSFEEIQNLISKQDFHLSAKHPKERSSELIRFLQAQLNPQKAFIHQKLQPYAQQLAQHQIDLGWDIDLDDSDLNIKVKIQDEADWKKKISELSQFDPKACFDILNGEDHV